MFNGGDEPDVAVDNQASNQPLTAVGTAKPWSGCGDIFDWVYFEALGEPDQSHEFLMRN